MISAHPSYDGQLFVDEEFYRLLDECQCYEQAAYLRCKQLAEEGRKSYWEQIAAAYAPPSAEELEAAKRKNQITISRYLAQVRRGELHLWEVPEPWTTPVMLTYYQEYDRISREEQP